MFCEKTHTLQAWPAGCAPGVPEPGVFGWEASKVAGGFSADGVVHQGAGFSGTYDEAGRWIREHAARMKALVLIFARGEGMELFLAQCAGALASIPTAGGAAARLEGCGRGTVFPHGSDVAAFALTDGKWESGTVLFHRPVGISVECGGQEPRFFARLRHGEVDAPAREWIEQRFVGLGGDVWNRVALLAPQGNALHMRPDGEGVSVSANLPPGRRVDLAVFDDNFGRQALERLVRPGSLVFGCAGLDALIAEPRAWEKIATTSYLYGEIVRSTDGPAFANLSFSVLSRVE